LVGVIRPPGAGAQACEVYQGDPAEYAMYAAYCASQNPKEVVPPWVRFAEDQARQQCEVTVTIYGWYESRGWVVHWDRSSQAESVGEVACARSVAHLTLTVTVRIEPGKANDDVWSCLNASACEHSVGTDGPDAERNCFFGTATATGTNTSITEITAESDFCD
jgi:hypothetical protein